MLYPGDISLVPTGLTTKAIKLTHPVSIVSLDSRVTYPPAPLSPVLTLRDNSRWCTERFTFSNSRKLNWDECLWQFWLDTYDRIGRINGTVNGIQEEKALGIFAVCCRSAQKNAVSLPYLFRKLISNKVQD
ncbi:hypothetical protein BDP27DRAFT_1340171 [Rhodocollybia butyracea]|uniref:Uncharacterized protein n=1 Tax=Rhodocollybia butyracea TaxID=206335 RepID=A0A9P5PB27_9AGAR|nr:hypothetical protein BDP27DRAFT_1340171 [Rhodocollybia butyracea]